MGMKLEFQKVVLFLAQHGIKYFAHYSETMEIFIVRTEDHVTFQIGDGTIYVSTGCFFKPYVHASEALEYALNNGFLKHKRSNTWQP